MTEQLARRCAQLEAELLERDKQLQRLQQVNAELSHFAHRAAHDLKAPLRSMMLYHCLIEEHFADKVPVGIAEYIAELERIGTGMNGLISALLQYSEFQQAVRLDETVVIGELIQGVTADLYADLRRCEGEIELRDDLVVVGNKELLRCLLFNLLGNAIKYHAKGGPAPAVVIAAQEFAHYWQFSVQDNGVGIAPEYHQKIFQPFERLHHSKEYEGRGLGLDFCSKVVALHQGTIWVESALGEGSTFYFTLSKPPA